MFLSAENEEALPSMVRSLTATEAWEVLSVGKLPALPLGLTATTDPVPSASSSDMLPAARWITVLPIPAPWRWTPPVSQIVFRTR